MVCDPVPPPPDITLLPVSPLSLEFSALAGGPPVQQNLQIATSGTGSLQWTATATLFNGGEWLGLSPPSGESTPGQASLLTVTADLSSLLPGTYQGVITIQDTGGNSSVSVAVSAVVRPSKPGLQISQSSFVFQISQGGILPWPQPLRVRN